MTICHPEPVEGWIARSSRAMTAKTETTFMIFDG